MKIPTPTLLRLLPFVLLFSTSFLFSQKSAVLEFSGTRMRAPLDVPEGQSAVQLCQLTPGQEYLVIAVGAAYGQKSEFDLALPGKAGAAGAPENLPAGSLRFTATSACMELLLTAHDPQPLTSIPLYLSVKCTSCPEDNSWMKKFADQVEAVNLSVAPGVNAQSLITNTLIGGNCFDVQNITATGNSQSRGTFTNGATNIGIQNGIVLCTGNAGMLPGPNTSPASNGGFSNNSGDDPDLAALIGGNQWDLSKIEFDFTPTANMVQFDFVFGSEEYCEFVGTQYNDVFGFFISGPGINGNQNIALIPGTSTPVAINNVNYLNNSAFYNNNTLFPPCTFFPQTAPNECELDGWTSVFTAMAEVIPCSTYHIKLAIADIGDSDYASAVFLRANSFDAGGVAAVQTIYPNGLNHAPEGCDTSYVRFYRGNSDNSQPLTISFNVSAASTATAGDDYAGLSSPVVIPAGQNEVLVPLQVFADTLTEGPEQIVVLLNDACTCTQTEFSILLDDKPDLSVDLPDQSVCEGATAILTPTVSGLPPFTYLWNTGDTSAVLLVTASGTNTYTVSVTDACGVSEADSAQVSILPLVTITENIAVCSGDSVLIDGIPYTAPASVTDTLPGAAGACDTIRIRNVNALPLPVLTDTIVFCAGDTVLLNGMLFTSSGTALDTLPGTGGGCDTAITYVLTMLPYPARQEAVNLCPGDAVAIGGVVYTAAATVQDTIPGMNGECDTIVTYSIALLPQQVRTEQIAFCPGGSVTIGGVVYSAPGTVLDTIPAAGSGCDTIVTYLLELLPQPTRSETVLFCPGETVTIGGNPYTLPGTVVDTLLAGIGCDTIVTYTLQYQTPAPSTVLIDCPADYSVEVESGTPAIVQYDLPDASSDCPCPGIALQLSAGLPSGSNFPAGFNQVCYTATDNCGNTASCCFRVTVTETEACDVKTVGCVTFELLSITKNSAGNKTYRIRVTNNCTNTLNYVAFELPPGQTAVKPADNSTFITPAGRSYAVRNPNASPFYSIRFAATGTGISNGESDIFAFTLPQQSSPDYFHVIARINIRTFYEAYLNTFFCPVGTGIGAPETTERNVPQGGRVTSGEMRVFPNPTNGTLFIEQLPAGAEQAVRIRVLNSRGQLVLEQREKTNSERRQIQLPEGLAEGLYFLEVWPENGTRQVARFVLHSF